MQFINNNTGWAVGGSRALILKTINGGTNWIYQSTAYSTFLRSVFFLDENTGWTAGESSLILKTTNGGTNWTLQPISAGLYPYINSIYFINEYTGWSVGWLPTMNHGIILNTTNGGNNWINQSGGTGNKLNSVHFINNNTGWIAGDDGTILKTTNGGITPIGIEPAVTQIPGSHYLFQNYPNPFNPTTNLEFQISKHGFVSLKIYDLLGKEVAALVNENLNPGKYKFNFDASNLASGIYFYKLTADGFTDTKRMMLLK